ncbi:MAG: hypothetical protein ACRDQY_09605 [Pseudonocardiaceae bacterium]
MLGRPIPTHEQRTPPPHCPPGQADKFAVLLDALDGVVISGGERANLI